jgi:TM2 domain-containing membrane protein YozV
MAAVYLAAYFIFHKLSLLEFIMEEWLLMKDMTDTQKMLFQSELLKVKKDRNVAFLLTLFFGGFGVHHFYLSKIGFGILYLLFCWALIPFLIAFIELFFIMKRVDNFNSQKAHEIASKVRLY